MQETMKTIRIHARGGPEQLVYEDAPCPVPGPADALVRVSACAITPAELGWAATYENPNGSPRIPGIPGHEFSGVVENLPAGEHGIRAGDAVYGLADFRRDGALAEYVAVRSADLAPKPRTLDDARAAAVPLSALTAWQALVDHAGITAGQRVLIHGGAGGVGSFAVQLAHIREARVIATASARDAEFVRELGADEVLDYTRERFEDRLRDVDMVLDTMGGDTRARSWSVLRRGGILVALTGPVAEEEASKHGVRAVFFIVKPSRGELIEIGRLIEEARLRPIVETVLPLDQARKAFELGLRGHHRGKIVLQVAMRKAA